MNSTVKYVAELTHVREVSLFGAADLDYWKDRLAQENLVPIDNDGRAQLLIIGADSRYMGIRFRELSFSVLLSQRVDGFGQNQAYLAHAFNTSRLLALCERAFFSTPYYRADVRISASFPPSIQVLEYGETVFQAEMGSGESRREPSRNSEDGWEGPAFLPMKKGRRDRQANFFFVRIRGRTQAYPFVQSEDSLTIRPSRDSQIFQQLIDSHFVATEWAVRADATHARSKTYMRSEVFAAWGRT
jgi:hypothetical protein